jgi:hypothetical protein
MNILRTVRKRLASLGYLEGEPTIEIPTEEMLKALPAEQD